MPLPIVSIDDARQQARCRLPRMVFDFIDGAAGNEIANQRNQEAFNQIFLQPRVLFQVETRHLSKPLLGRDWGLPFGIAPMGMCNLAWPNADKMLATAAAKHNIPVCLSTAGSSTIEEMHQWAGPNAWFQLYVGASVDAAWSLVDRAKAAQYETLILTVDVPKVASRYRDVRNGFQMPFRIGPRQFFDFATHPRWSIETLIRGAPHLANFSAKRNDGDFKRNEGRGLIDLDFLHQLRKRWPGKLIVKGVLSVEDTKRVLTAGVDAIYVSNHGGRQLQSAPPAIQILPKIREAVGPGFPILFDSGIRCGDDVLKALALGADFVMLGRPFLYAVAADGAAGLEKMIHILKNEISVAMAQIGKSDIQETDSSIIAHL